jgi:hypothetical protein
VCTQASLRWLSLAHAAAARASSKSKKDNPDEVSPGQIRSAAQRIIQVMSTKVRTPLRTLARGPPLIAARRPRS